MRRRLASMWKLRKGWRELLHSKGRPRRTAAAFGLGALIGATPILGIHTWIAAGLAALFRLPPLSVILGTNISNPLTFIPITLLEVRVGSWLLGRPFRPLPEKFRFEDLSSYLLEAWVGWSVVGSIMAILSFGIVAIALHRRSESSAVSVDENPL